MMDGTIYQGEPFNIKVTLFDDNQVQLKASDYEVDMLLRKDNNIVKCWSNHNAKFDGVSVDTLVSIDGGMEYQAEVSAMETKDYAIGGYSYELRVTDKGNPSISIERNIVRVVESKIKNMTL